MKVCFLLHQGNMFSGGQGVYLYYLSRELADMGHEVHVIAGVPYPEVAAAVRLHKLKTFSFWALMDDYDEYVYRTHPLLFFHPVNFYEFASTRMTLAALVNMFGLRAYHKLNELEAGGSFDVIHDNQTLGYGSWLMRASGRSVVANVHHPLDIDRQNELAQARSLGKAVSRIIWFPWVMQSWVARRLDAIITGSESSAASIVRTFDLPRDRIRVIYDGVDPALFGPREVEREPTRVLFVGRAEDKNKGFRYLLEALRLLEGVVPWELTVVQPPGSREAERLIAQMGVQRPVYYLEGLDTEQLARTYNSAQVLVSPSLYEGFGLPAAEALACGTPVVATTAGALGEIVEDGVCGLLVPPRDATLLADAIRTLLEDRERAAAMGEAGTRRIRERFSWRRTAEETLELYRDVLACRAAGTPR